MCAIQTAIWLTDFVQNSRDADRRMLYVNGRTPLAEPLICKNLLQISPRANSQFQIRKGMMKHGYLLYVHGASVTCLVPCCLVPCLSRYPPFNALCTPSTCRSQTFSRLNLGKPRSTYIIQIQYNVWKDRPTFRQSQRQYDSVLRII